MIKWDRTYLLLLIVVFTVIIGFGYFFFNPWLQPERTQLATSMLELEQQERLIQATEVDQVNIEELLAEAETLQNQVTVDAQVDQLLFHLSEIEGNSGILIERMVKTNDQLAGENSSHYPEDLEPIQYQIQFKATDYEEMNQFLTAITELERSIDISQLQYSETTTGDINATITIIFFHNPTLTELLRAN